MGDTGVRGLQLGVFRMLTSFHWRLSQGAFNPPSPDATVESTPWYAGSCGNSFCGGEGRAWGWYPTRLV